MPAPSYALSNGNTSRPSERRPTPELHSFPVPVPTSSHFVVGDQVGRGAACECVRVCVCVPQCPCACMYVYLSLRVVYVGHWTGTVFRAKHLGFYPLCKGSLSCTGSGTFSCTLLVKAACLHGVRARARHSLHGVRAHSWTQMVIHGVPCLHDPCTHQGLAHACVHATHSNMRAHTCTHSPLSAHQKLSVCAYPLQSRQREVSSASTPASTLTRAHTRRRVHQEQNTYTQARIKCT